MAASTIITGQFVRISQTPASLGERLLALLLDWILLALYIFGLVTIISSTNFSDDTTAGFIILFLLYIAPLFYSLLCEIFYEGRTYGKYLVNIRVIKADGTTPSLSAYLLRWLLFPIDILFSGGVGVVCILLTRNNQRLGDLAAGTLVIKEQNYKKIQVSLDEYDFLTQGYRPVYPQAADLSLEQIHVISRTLGLGKDRNQRIEQLAVKVRTALSITAIDASSERFLETLLRDYQYYALEEI